MGLNMNEDRKKLLGDLVELLKEEDFKKTLLKELNKEIDLPVLNEKKEGKLFKVIYDVLLKFISKKFLD
ncbi:MAG: hypothetical protein CML47_06820 [Rhodobacteraceae bacterium]|nr:MAG: hypothetical protein CML47_06820 [Paracoccaceae bacterium]|tara:strand:- start:7575 stop:7781 length:207 start_codon:yes stop_codon:yes gene_type:complete